MGVPAFFRWLSRKYSSIIVHCNEERKKEINGVEIPIDTSLPNPNDVEFDNFYLDMNGIIHPCSHPEDRPAPKNEVEIMFAIFEAIDRLFGIVRPRRLLYMAIDGVAPRAKMNQQRSRRFRASKESAEGKNLKEQIIAELRERGAVLPADDPKKERFDSNCITPGTEFMFRLANCLRFYIQDRINNDPGWKNILVILSDANVPGEGEHKIMDFIRRQRGQESHDPNTHHCICGADADLIMLGLATHEPNFTIIREEFKPNQPKPCGICSQYGHDMEDCQGMPRDPANEAPPPVVTTDYIFIRLNVVREYLARELAMPGLPFKYDLENVLDDWVMMCFFVGNDFLPHLPSLEIREGAIDKLVRLYKNIVHQTGGYLTKNGIVNLSRVEKIMRGIGEMEDEIFRRRRESDLNYRAREKAKRQKTQSNGPAYIPGGAFAPVPLGRNQSPAVIRDFRKDANENAASALRSMLKESPKQGDKKAESSTSPSASRKRKHGNADEDSEPEDDVRLWEEGWKDRYYRNKFNVSLQDYEFRRRVVHSYVQGLCWVLAYYYQGCASWKWFFPFHYAPFASDFVDIAEVSNIFKETTKPKNPLEQLMCVFPAASGNFLPESWRDLMSNPDSPIIDFYPTDFKIDLNGKKYAWQGVAHLPFVDEDRMMKTLSTVYPDLIHAERKRNELGCDRIFVGPQHSLHAYIKGLYENQSAMSKEDNAPIDPKLTKGLAGNVWADEFCNPDSRYLESPLEGLDALKVNHALSMCYNDPQYPAGHIFEAKLLPGAKIPEPTVKPEDWNRFNPNQGWKPRIGFNPDRKTRAQIDGSGHRHLRHSLPRPQYPPPSSYRWRPPNSYHVPRSLPPPPPANPSRDRYDHWDPYHNHGGYHRQSNYGSRDGYHDQRDSNYRKDRYSGYGQHPPRSQQYQHRYPSSSGRGGGYSRYGRY